MDFELLNGFDAPFIIIIIIMKAKIIVTLYIKNVTGALYTVNYNENTLSVSVSVNAATSQTDPVAELNNSAGKSPQKLEKDIMLACLVHSSTRQATSGQAEKTMVERPNTMDQRETVRVGTGHKALLPRNCSVSYTPDGVSLIQ